MNDRTVYIVVSYTDTWPGRLIVVRAKLKFWNRYEGDTYSHISISQDLSLAKMYSFARRTMYNPFNAGLIQESIYEGMFSRKPHINRMAVFELSISEEQYKKLGKLIEEGWNRRDILKFNYLGIVMQLCVGRGTARKPFLLFTVGVYVTGFLWH